MTAPPEADTGLPSTVGPFKVLRLLGSGGMGRVYLAATRAGRPVAVKVVRDSYVQDPRFRERFRVEAEAALKVSGAFTAPVLAADPDSPQPWLATAYLPAPSLTEAVSTHGPMPEETVRRLAAGLAEALAAIHAAGLVHRDLKPSNILLTEDGPRVIDFGIARAVDGERLTETGQVLGTAGYVPPEQIAGRTPTAAGDVFSLGATLVFAACGRGAFGASGLHILLYRTAYEEPDLSAVPAGLRPALAACLAKDPRQRPQVADLARLFGAPHLPGAGWLPQDVEREVRYREEKVRTDLATHGAGPRWGRRRVLTTAGGTLAAALAGGWYLAREGSGDTPAAPRQLWSKALPDGFTQVRKTAGGRLLATGKDGAGAAVLAPDTGKAAWQSAPYGNAGTATAGDTVYVIEIDGALHARELTTGKERWHFAPPGDTQPDAGDLTAYPGTRGWVYVTSEQTGRLYALDSSGKVRWQHAAARTVVHPLGDVLLCVAREPGGTESTRTVRALHARTGDQVWKYTPAVYGLGVNPGPRLALTLRADTARLVGLRVSDGRALWTVPTGLDPGEAIQNVSLTATARLGPDGRTALFQNSLASGSFAALDTSDGSTRWRQSPKDRQQLVPLGSTLFTVPEPPAGTDITAAHGPLTSYDLTSGTRHWQTADLGKALYAVLGTFSGLVLVGLNGGSAPGVYGYALDDGKRVWKLPYTVDTLSQPWSAVTSGSRLWVASESEVMGFTAG
ncbi:PQQ-binding-like beta-propeller repeat protein [Streptomyces sp. NPDC048277]|uniref:protein kinase domain-containing protein n=1 Tax=Streptomyces sp. NPDC048277 TaxID=3155027 RepID=UPI0033E07D5F